MQRTPLCSPDLRCASQLHHMAERGSTGQADKGAGVTWPGPLASAVIAHLLPGTLAGLVGTWDRSNC